MCLCLLFWELCMQGCVQFYLECYFFSCTKTEFMSAWNEILWVVMLCGAQNAFNAESALFSLNKTKTETMKKKIVH